MLDAQAEAKPAAALTILDWIGLLVTTAAIGWVVRWPFVTAPAFEKMFKDMGGALPGLTELVLTRPLSLAVALSVAGLSAILVLATVFVRAPIGVRRLLGVVAFGLSGGASALFLYAAYLPVFNLAAAVQ